MIVSAATISPDAVRAAVASPTADAAARAAGFASYADYLDSPVWRCGTPRLGALRIASGHCRICNAGRDIRLEVHHRCYERLGAERPGDLIAVCPDCHDDVGDMIRRRRSAQTSRPSSPAARKHGANQVVSRRPATWRRRA